MPCSDGNDNVGTLRGRLDPVIDVDQAALSRARLWLRSYDSGKHMPALLDLDALRAQPLVRDPFDHVVVRHFLPAAAASAACADFPNIAHPGVLPADGAACGPGLAAVLSELRSPTVSAAFSAAFGVDLTGLPLMVTLRGRCRAADGKIHADSESKVVTALLYLNETWEAPGGRLRLLRRPDDL